MGNSSSFQRIGDGVYRVSGVRRDAITGRFLTSSVSTLHRSGAVEREAPSRRQDPSSR